MQYKICAENEPNGEGNGWFECSPEDVEQWSVWTVEDNENMEVVLDMFDTKAEAQDFLDNLLLSA